MSRHRNIRSMNYDEEYDGYDDVYGHSVEDDYATSPSVQQFIYDRNMSRSAHMDSDIPEEEEPYTSTKEDEVDFKPKDDMEEVQMLSCLDFIKERLGDKHDVQAAKRAVLASNFDAEKALDSLLQQKTVQPPLPVLPKAKATATGFASKDSRPSGPTFAQKPSLSQLASLKIGSSPPVPNLKLGLPPKILQPKDGNVQSLKPSLPSQPGARPSLSQLAKIRLSGNEAKVSSAPLSKPSLLTPSLNLASALKTKCTISEPSRPKSVVCAKDKFTLLPRENRAIDTSLVKSRTSAFGRVLAMEHKSHRIMKKGSKKSLFPKVNCSTIKAFKFTEPSPDDLILSRLRR